jgi:gluconate kinase
MLAGMLKSQLATLEEPDEQKENVIVAPIDPPTNEIARHVIDEAKARRLIYID